jgi:hypothetical protein
MRVRSRSARLSLVSLVIGLTLTLLGGQATAEPTCTWDDGEVRVVLGPNEAGTLSVGSGDEILIDGGSCDFATQGKSTGIVVTGDVGDETLVVDEAGPGGSFSLRITVDLASGAADRLVVVGTPGDDVIEGRGAYVSFNDRLIPFDGVEETELDAAFGNDVISVAAIGTGIDDASPSSTALSRITARGGEGDDILTGSSLNDLLFGEGGMDTLDGGPGTDVLIGGEGLGDTCLLDGAPINCDPSIAVSRGHGLAGSRVTLSGGGWFPENGVVQISLGGVPVTAFPVPTGSFSEALAIPDLEAGSYDFTACQRCPPDEGETSLPVPFTVDDVVIPPPSASPAPRSLALRPSSAAPGEDVVVVGRGWSLDEGTVAIFVRTNTGGQTTAIATAEPSRRGRFSADFVVPHLGDGPYEIVACQHCGESVEIELSRLLAVPAGASLVPWIAAALFALLVLGLGAAGLRSARLRRTPTPQIQAVRYVLRRATPRVQVSKAPGASADHSIRLVPHRDVGVQRVEEMIGS